MLDPLTFAFLIIGGMIPFAFAAMTMKSVGIAAMEIVLEVQRQFKEKPHLLDANSTKRPDYDVCIAIFTNASLQEMIPPGILVIFTPFLTGIFFGAYAVSGLLVGSLIASVQLAISMSNSRGSDAYEDDAVTAQWQQRRHQYRASTRSKQGDFEGFFCLSGLWMKYLGLWMTLVLQERSDVGIQEGLPSIKDSHKLSTQYHP